MGLKEWAEEMKGGKLDKDEEKEFDDACDEMEKDLEGAMKKMKKKGGEMKKKGGKGGKGGKKDKKVLVSEKEEAMKDDADFDKDDMPTKEEMEKAKADWEAMTPEE